MNDYSNDEVKYGNGKYVSVKGQLCSADGNAMIGSKCSACDTIKRPFFCKESFVWVCWSCNDEEARLRIRKIINDNIEKVNV